ncbi:MAG: carboxypeptidase regulatory-like domain-containing protein [Deltaproteobacteria bacterium]
MYQPRCIGALVVGGGILASSLAEGQAIVGSAYDALPGLYRVPVAELAPAHLSGALSVGYGITEAQPSETGAHQRLSFTPAVSVVPIPRLQLSVRSDIRYDRHPDDGHGQDSGTTLAPTFAARWVQPVSASVALGVELGVWLPGTEALSPTLEAASPHALLFGTMRRGPITLTSHVGYRIDRSRAASPDLEGIRAGDRLALGLSDFDAGLAAIGMAYFLGRSWLFAELRSDILLGSGAPPFLESPLAAAAGARYHVSDSWTLELLASASLSKRPALAAADPLVPVEPRLAALAGIRVHWPVVMQPSRSLPRPDTEARRERVAPKLASIQLSVRLAPAKPSTIAATLSRDGRDYPLASRGEGEFELADVPSGSVTLRVSAEGYRESVASIEVPETGVQRLEIELQAALRAQVRGLVRSLDGRSLQAHIRIEPLALVGKTDADGFFELDVPPGKYSVTVEAEGFRAQKRDVVLERDAVVVLNADLLRAP